MFFSVRSVATRLGLTKSSADTRELVAAMDRIPGWKYDPTTRGGSVAPRALREFGSGGWVGSEGHLTRPWTGVQKSPSSVVEWLRSAGIKGGGLTPYQKTYLERNWRDIQRLRAEAPPGGYGPDAWRADDLRRYREYWADRQHDDPLRQGSTYRKRREKVLPAAHGAPIPQEFVTRNQPSSGTITVGKQTTLSGAPLPDRHQRAARAVTLMHEVDERRLPVKRTSPGWSHTSPEVLFNESNLHNRLTGPSSKTIRDHLTELRVGSGEADDLHRMVQNFSGGRYNYQYGDKMPKAMKRAIVRWLQRGGR